MHKHKQKVKKERGSVAIYNITCTYLYKSLRFSSDLLSELLKERFEVGLCLLECAAVQLTLGGREGGREGGEGGEGGGKGREGREGGEGGREGGRGGWEWR